MKKIISTILVMLFALNFITVGYAMPAFIENVKIEGDENITIHVGDEITLEATAKPVGFDYAYILWTTDNDNVTILTGNDEIMKLEPPVSTVTIKAIKTGTVVVTAFADLSLEYFLPELYPDAYESNSITINVVSGYSSGDSNGDTEIDVKDVVAIRRFLVGGYYETIFEDTVDVIKDGRIDVMDIILLRRYVAGGYGVEL